MSIRLLRGDCLEVLRTLPAESVHMCVTSPPYFQLRDYGVAGQIGLEATPDEYVAKLVEVFAEVWQVLRPDGTLWLNIGDSYAGSGKGPTGWNGIGGPGHQELRQGFSAGYVMANGQMSRGGRKSKTDAPDGYKAKDLLLIPFRLAIALQAYGWYVRSDIAWCKKSCMPESVQDRPTSAWEHVFLLSKQPRYFYDADAVREPLTAGTIRVSALVHSQPNVDASRNDKATIANFAPLNGANMRNFWLLGPEPYAAAHFATFVPEIPRRAILAGCPVGGTVLDPFAGAGTTGLVADRLGRNAVLIELNPAYADMAAARIAAESPMFAEVDVA